MQVFCQSYDVRNNIYDRYIEINVPCLLDLINNKHNSGNTAFKQLNVSDNTNIKLHMAYVLDEDKNISVLSRNQYTEQDKAEYPNVDTDLLNLTFSKSSTLNGVIPTSDLNSDNLGAYIAECHDMPYLEFYATWRDKPIDAQTVWSFNKNIRLYDRSLIKDYYDDEVGANYVPEYDMQKWLIIHEIKCSFCNADKVIKEETYSMTQVFVNDTDAKKFVYRPIIFDEPDAIYIDNMQVVYTMRLINAHDKVQFVKVATLSMSDNLSKYYAKGTTLKIPDLVPYKFYNKIIENKQDGVQNTSGIAKTKYVKVFYNSTDVVLDDNGNLVDGMYNYTLNMSVAPKSYKFTFKTVSNNGSYKYMDLSNGYYKILFKDEGGNDVMVEPTFSSNMNLYVGELEFNFTPSMVNKLSAVSEDERKMSIVVYNEDGSVSSMFDFLYTI